MSKYTTQIRFIVEMNSKDGQPISKRIEESLPRIFNFNYPLWSEEYRRTLEKKIIMHYFNKEIGFETIGLWKLYLEERLNLIMPYYNSLYKTVSKEYEWLENVDLKEEFTGVKDSVGSAKDNVKNEITDEGKDTTSKTVKDTTENKGKDTTSSKLNENSSSTGKDVSVGNETSNNSNNNTTTNKQLKSDLPQANYNNLDYGTGLQEDNGTNKTTSTSQTNNSSTIDKTSSDKHDVINEVLSDKSQNIEYNSSGNIVTDKNNKSTSNTIGETNTSNKIDDKSTKNIKGLNGNKTRTELNIEYRNSLLNIDKLIIEELKDLFMLIY